MVSSEPALAVNVAVVTPAATVTDAGTVSTLAIPPPIVTEDPPVGAAWFSVTVHVVLAFDASEDAPQLIDDTSTGATSDIPKVCEAPLIVALNVAV